MRVLRRLIVGRCRRLPDGRVAGSDRATRPVAVAQLPARSSCPGGNVAGSHGVSSHGDQTALQSSSNRRSVLAASAPAALPYVGHECVGTE